MSRATLDIDDRYNKLPEPVTSDNSVITLKLSPGFVHSFVGIVYYASDAEDAVHLAPVTLVAGAATIKVKTLN